MLWERAVKRVPLDYGGLKNLVSWQHDLPGICFRALGRAGIWGRDTSFKTQYDWRKIKPVRMKATIIHFWCLESEFIVKNEFHNWTSELGYIWHIFGKIGSFQVLQLWQQPVFKKLRRQQPNAACTWALKKSLIFQKCAKCNLTLMSAQLWN